MSFEAGFTPTGRRRRVVVTAKREADVLRKFRAKRREYETLGDVPTALSASRWFTYWLDEVAARRVRPRTLQSYRLIVRLYLDPVLGKRRLDQLAPQHVRDLQRDLEHRGLAPSTARKAHAVLRKALEDALREGKVTRNVAKLVDAPRSTAVKSGEALTVDDAKRLLRSVAADPYAARWACALLLGARQGELLGLQWARVDLDAAEVDLAGQLQRLAFRHGCTRQGDAWSCGRVRPGSCPDRQLDVQPGFEHQQLEGGLCLTRPKSRAGERVVPLPAAVVAILRRQRETAPANPHDLVWARPDGRPIDPKDDRQAWLAALEAAGLPATKLHNARHTAATFLLALGVDVKVIGQILGHSEAVTTRGYQHVDRTLARAAMTQQGELLALED
jgi:integrase